MQQEAEGPSIDIGAGGRAQEREWRFERAGWILIVVLLAAGLAGVFGDGPFAHAVTAANGRASLRYDRVVHFGATTRLSLTLIPSHPDDSVTTVWLDRAYLDKVDVERVVPQPAEMPADDRAVAYRFTRLRSGRPLQVDFSITPTSPGVRDLQIRTADDTLTMRQLVLP